MKKIILFTIILSMHCISATYAHEQNYQILEIEDFLNHDFFEQTARAFPFL